MQEFDNWLRKEKLLSLIKLLNVQLYLPKSEFDINDNKINWRMDRFSQRNCILENKHQEILRKNWSQGYYVLTALNTSFTLSRNWRNLSSTMRLLWLKSQLLNLADKPDICIFSTTKKYLRSVINWIALNLINPLNTFHNPQTFT